ncbi:family 78 glycoside hydrolase catalytic domain [Olivibacter sp. SDN3]|uniref:family 78 glycoside hydrolase catalytic domain n=1 Tax=Olivibacter sp. SDN3 TaxID=2764720 RepID=UPI001650EEC0|nr:family 78 glycoside hydrolase catalytic domain [Olivibacter sp. SDN3]QNL50453.1 family 78 glycoside hydrolase catalytic domain [Olivibacter sp. SDN3]
MSRLYLKTFLLFIILNVCGQRIAFAQRSTIVPKDLRYEYLINPIGMDEQQPRFSWTLKASDTTAYGQRQTAYRILVSSEEKLLAKEQGDMWDSDWKNSGQMQQILYEGKPLQADRKYYWKIAVKDEKGKVSSWSEPAHWSTGLFEQSAWLGQWIGTDQLYDPSQDDCNIVDPWLRKTFEIKSKPGKATLFVASIGFHEVYVNGKKVGDDVMAPAATDHTKRARYVAYDIAPALKKGKNVVAIWLGTSWSIHGAYIADHRPNTLIVIAQAAIFGDQVPGADAVPDFILKTDNTWKTHPSPNKLLGTWDFNRMGGELWDANGEVDDWNQVACDESTWKPATVYAPKLSLSAQQVERNQLLDEIVPLAIEERPDGSYRVDMGVNFAGWTEVNVTGTPGDTVSFLYSEREQDDMTFGLHSAYIIGKSGKGTFRNRFNYSSGRWITIKGLKSKPKLTDIRGWLVRTGIQSASSFKCSDSLQNWIYNKVRWTFENLSLGGYIVDCPQRERLGYGGDAHATCETGMLNYHMGAFYTKWMEDWRDVSGTETVVGNMYDTTFARKAVMGGRILNNGVLPHTAPTYAGGGGPAWGGIVVTLPWVAYQQYGDERILEQNFALINGWLSFLDTHTKEGMLQRYGGAWDFLGDWLWPNATAEGMNNDKLETLCLNNSYRVYNLRTAAKIARVIGKDVEAEHWESQADKYSKVIHDRFFNATDNSYADSSMTNLAAALLAEVVPHNLREQVLHRLEQEILVKKNGHIHAGITGGAILFKLLRELGRDDLIYAMTSQTDYPSWGYMKANDATTIWEMWEKDLPGHSLLHSSYLYPGAWYIDGLGGIRQDPKRPGYSRFIVRPPALSASQLSWAETTFDAPAGLIRLKWKRQNEQLLLDITVPPNCTAELQIADTERVNIDEQNPFIKKLGSRNGVISYELEAGRYAF